MAKSMAGSAPSNASSSKDKKKRKKSARRLLSAPASAARKSTKPARENPFDLMCSRRKLDVVGKKRKGEDRRVSRSHAVEKRRRTLLKDYEQSRKSSTFIDKRIGESNDDLGEFEKGILRLQRERQLKLKKENKYNLSDGEEDDSGLRQAELLSNINDFQDEVPLDDDDDDDEADMAPKDFTAIRHLSFRSMHNPLEPSLGEEEENRQKTKKQVMEEIIAKSKFYKAQKAMEKEADEHLMDQLDKDFTSLLQSKVFVSLSQPNGINALEPFPSKSHTNGSVGKSFSISADKASTKEQPDAYDKLVRVLPTEKRAHPTNRKKSAEEIAQEERERLELLEEERRRRMHSTDDSDDEEHEDDDGDDFGKSSPKKSKHVSGDDLGDSLSINEDVAEKTCRVDDIVGNRLGGTSKDEDNKSSEDSQDDNDQEEDEQEEDDDDDNDEEEEDDGDKGNSDDILKGNFQNVPSAEDWEQSEDDDFSIDGEEAAKNSIVAGVQSLDAENAKNHENKCVRAGKKDASGKSPLVKKDSLPYVIEAPKNLRELCSLIDGRPEGEIVEAINRIRVCNTVRLSTENRRKMQVFYGVLVQYFAVLATRNPFNVKLINFLVKPLVEMSVETPYFAAICARERLLHIRSQFCEDVKNAEKSSWPSLKTLILLRLWSLTFPCSDFRHVVMTPATLLICEWLMRCPIVIARDTAIGSFLCSMLLSVAKESLKFYPEVMMFLQLLLMSATKSPESKRLSHFYAIDLKTSSKTWLYLHNRVSDIHPIDIFSIMSMPANSPFFISDSFKASVLVSVVETLQGFVNMYERLSSFPEIFLPISLLLHEVSKQDTTPGLLQEKMTAVDELIKKKAEEVVMLRRPLQMRKEKPAPIKLLNPKFEEKFFKGMDYDPDRERVERKKLKKLLKKEAKGAARELRKDNYFLHDVKEKERLLLEEERIEMYGKARAFLQDQEHNFKSGQLGKGRKRRR